MFSMLLWRLASFLSLSVSFLVWLECVFLGRLCWLYCGLLGSVLFFFFFLLQCVRLPSLCSPSIAFVGCTAVFVGSGLALLECFSFLSFVYCLLYCI